MDYGDDTWEAAYEEERRRATTAENECRILKEKVDVLEKLRSGMRESYDALLRTSNETCERDERNTKHIQFLERELAEERKVSEGRRKVLFEKADAVAAEWRRAEAALGKAANLEARVAELKLKLADRVDRHDSDGKALLKLHRTLDQMYKDHDILKKDYQSVLEANKTLQARVDELEAKPRNVYEHLMSQYERELQRRVERLADEKTALADELETYKENYKNLEARYNKTRWPDEGWDDDYWLE